MTAPDNACPVEQIDRDFVADWILIAGEKERRVRAGEWDHHEAVQAAARHRQRTLPPVAEVMERVRAAISAQILHERSDEDRRPGYVKIETAVRALAALTNLQTGSTPMTDAGGGGA